MFGPIMRFKVGDLFIEMAPIKREDMPSFIKSGGMQKFEVTKYLGQAIAPVLEDEYEWFDKCRGDATTVCWGIHVVIDEKRKLIGNTSLNGINREVMPYATSGCLIFDQNYWGKGIAKHCHRARTWYGFTQLGLVQIRSAAYDLNIGSQKALESVGYVPVFHERNFGFVDGRYIGMTSYNVINPLKDQWRMWWHGDPIPPEYDNALKKAKSALRWAEENISFG